MKLIAIVVVFVAGLGFAGLKIFEYFDEKRQVGIEAQQKQKLREAEKAAAEKAIAEYKAIHPEAQAVSAVQSGSADLPVKATPPQEQVTVGSYRFVKRLVPPAPAFLKDESKVGMIVQTEEASNSWVWIGSPVLGSQIKDLAKAYDIRQMEMDLDFVLVLVNTERLQARGLSLFASEQASWLSALSLTADEGSLRITAGNVALDLSLSDTTTGLSLLSQPVIRCIDGQPWRFTVDSEVPVPKSEILEGTIRNSVDFRAVGFGLEGMVRVVGDSILMTCEQRNGSISQAASTSSDVPIFNNQVIKTSCELGIGQWSVIGGLQVDKEEMRRGIFRNSLKASSDYLVVFVRPRASLDAPPQALPVWHDDDTHPLLPPMEALDGEIQHLEALLGEK